MTVQNTTIMNKSLQDQVLDHNVLQSTYAEIRFKLRILLTMGQLLMENGADSSRIMRILMRSAAYMGIPWHKVNLHITYTTLMLNISDEDHSYTSFKRSRKHGININVINAVSQLSWDAVTKEYTLSEIQDALSQILANPRSYSPVITALGAGIATAGFCTIFGGDVPAFFVTMLCSALAFYLQKLGLDVDLNKYISTTISAFVATILCYTSHFLALSSTPWHPMLACALFLIPCMVIVTALNDFLNSYLICGLSRLIDAILLICSVTLGIVLALEIGHVSEFVSLSTLVVHHAPGSFALGGAAAALGFAILFSLPPSKLFIASLGGALAISLRNLFIGYLSLSPMIAVLLAASIISTLTIACRKIFRAQIIIIPAVIPMVPGLLLYRFLFSFINLQILGFSSFLVALENLVTALLILLSLSLGTYLPFMFARRYIRKHDLKRYYELIRKSHSHWH